MQWKANTGVTTVTAANASITIGGTASALTVAASGNFGTSNISTSGTLTVGGTTFSATPQNQLIQIDNIQNLEWISCCLFSLCRDLTHIKYNWRACQRKHWRYHHVQQRRRERVRQFCGYKCVLYERIAIYSANSSTGDRWKRSSVFSIDHRDKSYSQHVHDSTVGQFHGSCAYGTRLLFYSLFDQLSVSC